MKHYNMSYFGFSPVITENDLMTLNDEECVNGYLYGLKNLSPEENKTRSYYHGFLNGLNDGGHRSSDDDQKKLTENMKNSDYIKLHSALLYSFIDILNEKKHH